MTRNEYASMRVFFNNCQCRDHIQLFGSRRAGKEHRPTISEAIDHDRQRAPQAQFAKAIFGD